MTTRTMTSAEMMQRLWQQYGITATYQAARYHARKHGIHPHIDAQRIARWSEDQVRGVAVAIQRSRERASAAS